MAIFDSDYSYISRLKCKEFVYFMLRVMQIKVSNIGADKLRIDLVASFVDGYIEGVMRSKQKKLKIEQL